MRLLLSLFALTIVGYAAAADPQPRPPRPFLPCTSNDNSLTECGDNSFCCLCPAGGCCAPQQLGCPLGLYTGVETWPEELTPIPPRNRTQPPADGQFSPDGQPPQNGDLPPRNGQQKGDRLPPLDGQLPPKIDDNRGPPRGQKGELPPLPADGDYPTPPDGFQPGQFDKDRKLPNPEDLPADLADRLPKPEDGFLAPPRDGRQRREPPPTTDSSATSDESTDATLLSSTEELAGSSSQMRGGNNEQDPRNQSEGGYMSNYQENTQESNFIFFLLKVAVIAGLVYAGYRYYLYKKAQQNNQPLPQAPAATELHTCSCQHATHRQSSVSQISQNPPQYVAVPMSQFQSATPQAPLIQQAHPDQYHVLIPSNALFNDQQQYPPLLQKQN